MARAKKADAPTQEQEPKTLAPVVTQTNTPLDVAIGKAEEQTSTGKTETQDPVLDAVSQSEPKNELVDVTQQENEVSTAASQEQEPKTFAPVVTQTNTPLDDAIGKAEEQQASTDNTAQAPVLDAVSQGEPKAQEAQVEKAAEEKESFVLIVRNTGRTRLEAFTGTLLKSGEVTELVLNNQLEYDHVADTMRQFNELSGHRDLVILEGDD